MSQEDHPIEPPYLAVTPEQLRLMSFASRREIMAVLANDAGQSARELAVRLLGNGFEGTGINHV